MENIYKEISGFMAQTQDEMFHNETILKHKKLSKITQYISTLAENDKKAGFAQNADLISELHNLHMRVENYSDAR